MRQGIFRAVALSIATLSPVVAKPAELSRESAEALVDKLALIDSFDTGFSSTHGGLDFPPVAGQLQWSVGRLYAPDQHERRRVILHLVEAGPSALPVLLAHLDDARLTKLTVKHEQGFGAMWHAAEVFSPGWNPKEVEAIAAAALPGEDFATRETLSAYPVTVGDICFAICGMITNRSYNAVRYQPTACIVLNSPVKTPQIAKAVRSIWGEKPSPEALLASLNLDFDKGDNGAATRLLYYFPEQSAGRVHERLKASIAKKDDGLSRYLNAISWVPDEEIRGSIRKLLAETKDADLVSSGAPAFGTAANPALRDEAVKLSQRWKASKSDSGRQAGARLLEVSLEAWPDRARDTLAAWFKGATREAVVAGLAVAYPAGDLPPEPLAHLLDDRREGYGRYLKDGPGLQKEPQEKDIRTYRICDNTYEVICRSLGDRDARCTGEPAEMNEHIAKLKDRLAGNPANWHFSEAEIVERQAAQGKKGKSREALLERIRKAEPDPLRQSVLLLEEAGLGDDDWKSAAASLYDMVREEAENDEKPARIDIVAINIRLDRPRNFDRLDVDWQKRATAAVTKRCEAAMSEAGRGSYPSEDACDYFLLACHRFPETSSAIRTSMLAKLDAALKKNGFPEDDEACRAILLIADRLMELSPETATAWFAKLCGKATPGVLDETSCEKTFFEILARHGLAEPLKEVSTKMFLGPKAPWNPALLKHSSAGEMAGTKLLKLPAFRQALLVALRDSPGRNAVTGKLSVTKDDGDSYEIDWGDSSTSSSGVEDGQPLGVKFGDPPMDLRQVDALVEGLSNDVFISAEDVKMPEFHIYWPKKNRDEAIRLWIEELQK